MNEQVEQKANELLLSLIDKAQEGMEFAQAQIPDVIHQLLVWNAVASGFWTCVALLIVGGAMWAIRRAFRVVRDDAGEVISVGAGRNRDGSIDDGTVFPLGVVFVVVSLIGLIILTNNLDWLKIWLAPKLYLIEYAASLAK